MLQVKLPLRDVYREILMCAFNKLQGLLFLVLENLKVSMGAREHQICYLLKT